MFTRDLIEDLLSKSVEEHLHNKIEEIDKRNKEINAFITLSTEEAENLQRKSRKK